MLLFGDLAYDTIMKIFNYSEDHDREQYLEWDLLLAPHHCSKQVMYVREDGTDVLKPDILEAFERHARDGSVVVASSRSIPVVGRRPAPIRRIRRRPTGTRTTPTGSSARWSGPRSSDPSPVVFGDRRHRREDRRGRGRRARPPRARYVTPRRKRTAAVARSLPQRPPPARIAGGDDPASETAAVTGHRPGQAAISADRGSDAAPTTAVGFGRD